MGVQPAALTVVLDTNIVLDLLVFADAAAATMRDALARHQLDWIATVPMRSELARVLEYPQIMPRLAYYGLTAASVLARFDQNSRIVAVAAKALVICRDPDDQCFIDLAVAQRAHLLSKDRAVLCLRKRLQPCGVWVGSVLPDLAGLSFEDRPPSTAPHPAL